MNEGQQIERHQCERQKGNSKQCLGYSMQHQPPVSFFALLVEVLVLSGHSGVQRVDSIRCVVRRQSCHLPRRLLDLRICFLSRE